MKTAQNGNAIGSNAVLGLQEASIDVCSHDICVRLYLNNNGLDEFIGVYHLDKSSRLLKPVKNILSKLIPGSDKEKETNDAGNLQYRGFQITEKTAVTLGKFDGSIKVISVF